MSSPVVLNAIERGMTLQRTKGGPSPRSLLLLRNAYRTIEGTVKSRPSIYGDNAELDDTKGLVFFGGQWVVFSHLPKTLVDSRYRVETLRHPTEGEAALKAIHFAEDFVGGLFVVAEFEDEVLSTYWLQSTSEWLALTSYGLGAVVSPTTPNGYVYRATRKTPPGPKWAARVARTVGDVVEPTTANGYEYEVIETYGDNPISGDVEPTWPRQEDAIVIEDVDVTPNPGGTAGTGGTTLPPETSGRYPPSGSGGTRNFDDFGPIQQF